MESVLSDGMCRCCATEGNFKDFQIPYLWMGVEEVYSNMLKECFDITLSVSEEINNGGICEVCITQLRNACNFKQQVQATEDKFRKMIEERAFKTDNIKMEVTRFEDDDSNNSADDFSSQEYEVPIKVEKLEEKPKKRAAAKASTSKAKKTKTSDGETSTKRKLEESTKRVDDITMEKYISLRQWLESGAVHGSSASTAAWRAVWSDCSNAARALCERLRLVLEPTGRSRRAGDFRTGRAINMRRVIPYIASHFRKDRIWLRRTKPAKREYKIAIAIDDSSSMADNRSKELAFESLALVSQALNLLESGDLAVLSFGEKPNLLHPFTEQFSEHSGSKILEQLRFDQTKTRIAQLLDFCTVMFDQHSIRSDALNAKLLVIVSDGRGIFSEGETRVLQAVRRARQQGIFLVYVIIDNPDNKDSIMDIRRPILDSVTNSLTGFVPYLDTFPFPFYLILRDMNALPTVLGDALRQWFELAANTS